MKFNELLTCAAIMLAGCASQPSTVDHQTRPAISRERASEDDRERPPKIGMTKEEVLDRYGDPFVVRTNDQGREEWRYVFRNFDPMSMIPFYGPIHESLRTRRRGVIIFGAEGRVADFHWNVFDPVGGPDVR